MAILDRAILTGLTPNEKQLSVFIGFNMYVCLFVCVCVFVCLYLYSSVTLHDNSMGSVPKQVGKNQEVITVLSLLIG